MSISGMKLNLPDDIEADVGGIRSKCDTLDRLCSTMMGRAHDTEGNFNDAAAHFTDAVTWDIQGASAQEIGKWEDTGAALTNGAGVLRLWADDIETYRETREELGERWEAEKSDAQGRVDSPLHVTLGGPGIMLTDMLTDGKSDREAAEIENLEEIRRGLLSEHDTAWELLMDQAEQTESDLKDGPSPETYERMLNAGHMSWRHLGIFVPEEGPPLSEEQGEQAAEELEEYLDDPDGYEGDIGAVLAMLSVVTNGGVNNQRHGGQPPSDHMDFLEAFYEGLEDTYVEADVPRGVLGVVDHLDGNDDIDSEIAQGFLSSMGDGIMVLSDERLFGGWHRLPESIQMAASGPQIVPDDMVRDSGEVFYAPDVWGREIGALNRLLGSASSDLHAGEDLSASLALSLGNAAEPHEDLEPWIEESDALGLIDVASRNEDAMSAIFTGDYEHPFMHDENGDFREHLAFEDNDEFIDKAITGLYSTDWSDDGEAVRNMTDWIAEQADSDDPAEVRRSEETLVGLVDRLSGLKDELSNTGHTVKEDFNGEEVEWRDVSFGHLNPEIADSLAGMVESHVDIFTDPEIVRANGNIDPDMVTGYTPESWERMDGNGMQLIPSSAIIELGDRADFFQLISGSPEAAGRVVDFADEYTMNVLGDYTMAGDMGDGESGNPGTRAGLLWNAIGSGMAEEMNERATNHAEGIDDEKEKADFAASFVSSFIPNAQAAEVVDYISGQLIDSVIDGSTPNESNSQPPMEISEENTRIYAMAGAHNSDEWSGGEPPEEMADGNGMFDPDERNWRYETNTSATNASEELWKDVRGETWPGDDRLTVGDVADDFHGAFESALELNHNANLPERGGSDGGD